MRNTGPDRHFYVIAPSPDGPCKLGHSLSPTARLSGLQVGNHLELTIYSTWASEHLSALRIERRIHAILNDRCVRGEWFAVTVAEAEAIISKLDDKKAFDKSKEYLAMLTRAAACHPRAFT